MPGVNMPTGSDQGISIPGPWIGGGGKSGGTNYGAASQYLDQVHADSGAGGGGTPGSNKQLAQQLFTQYFPASEWNAFDTLEMHEAGYNNTAKNPSSTAYGMGQFLDSTWGGYGAKTSDPTAQLQYMFEYIKDRYGSPSAAWAQYYNHPGGVGWYDAGGWLPPGPSLVMNDTGGPEPVLTQDQWNGIISGQKPSEYMRSQDEITNAQERKDDLVYQIQQQQQRISQLQSEVNDANGKVADAQKTALTANDPSVASAQKSVDTKQRELDDANHRLDTLKRESGDQDRKITEAQLSAQERQYSTHKGSTRKVPGESAFEELGGGLLKGLGQELGFGDVFGKAPWDWGITKLLGGMAGWGLGTANAWADEIGKGHTGMTGFQPIPGFEQAGGDMAGLLTGLIPGVKNFMPKSLGAAPNVQAEQNPVAFNPLGGPTGPAPGPVIQGDYMPISVNSTGPTAQENVRAFQEQNNSRVATYQGGLPTP